MLKLHWAAQLKEATCVISFVLAFRCAKRRYSLSPVLAQPCQRLKLSRRSQQIYSFTDRKTRTWQLLTAARARRWPRQGPPDAPTLTLTLRRRAGSPRCAQSRPRRRSRARRPGCGATPIARAWRSAAAASLYAGTSCFSFHRAVQQNVLMLPCISILLQHSCVCAVPEFISCFNTKPSPHWCLYQLCNAYKSKSFMPSFIKLTHRLAHAIHQTASQHWPDALRSGHHYRRTVAIAGLPHSRSLRLRVHWACSLHCQPPLR